MSHGAGPRTTERLDLRPAGTADVDALFAILSDPAGWTHAPASRHTTRRMTERYVERSVAKLDADGLSYWTVRLLGTAGGRGGGGGGEREIIGIGGVQRHSSGAWNLAYRIATAYQGRGYAVELGRAAVLAAGGADASAPVIAWILEHHAPSRTVAERIGLVNRGLFIDANDGQARLAYADRDLDGFGFVPAH